MTRSPGRPTAGTSVLDESTLLDAALAAFAEEGFDGASVRDLCRRLGVSHNLIHQRYGSKDRLWYAAIDHGFGMLAVELAAAVTDDLPDDLGRLRAVWIRFLEVSAAAPALLQVMNQEATTPGPRIAYIHDRYVAPATATVAEMLDRLRAEGRVRPMPAGTLHFLVAHGAGGPLGLTALADLLGVRADPSDPAAVRAYAESVVDLLLGGLAVQPSAVASSTV